MLKIDYNLSDLADEYQKIGKNKAEEIDELYGYLITATAVVTLIVAPNPASAIASFATTAGMGSIKISNLLSWLPDKWKFGKKGRGESSLERFNHIGRIHFLLANLAIREAFESVYLSHIPLISEVLQLNNEKIKQFEAIGKETDERLRAKRLQVQCMIPAETLCDYAQEIIQPLINTLLSQHSDLDDKIDPRLKALSPAQLLDKFNTTLVCNYNAYLLSLSSQFPELAIWADLSRSQEILSELRRQKTAIAKVSDATNIKALESTVKVAIKRFDKLYDQSFKASAGLGSFDSNYIAVFKKHSDEILNKLSAGVKENIQAHHSKIISDIEAPLIRIDQEEETIYPRVKDIYIPQGYEVFSYRKKMHGRKFLVEDFWSTQQQGEDIGNELLLTIADPFYCYNPVVVLGNPGAGKSMLSKMFAGTLSQTTDYMPFLIKLRNVGSGTANINEHIAKGLSKSIDNLDDVNWIEWAKEFKDRTPVIILDGFDELMQFSQSELNGYITNIQEFQHTALHHGICVRVILTSRITVMQEVNIPERTKIIKLKGFDSQRKELWSRIWNNHQQKLGYKFILPENANLQELAQEPLLLFMLAIYDFEDSALQKMTAGEQRFSQSRLYDSLMENFAVRQLDKHENFKHLGKKEKGKELETFRLRLGMVALLMFLNNTTNRDVSMIDKDEESFGLKGKEKNSEQLIGGFFFIHENKSTTEGEVEKLNYEFLHKTFGEFLAADFLLRVTLKQAQMADRDKLCEAYTFRFCFGYNWLHRHEKILSFLMEHAPNLIKPGSHEAAYITERIIKEDLRTIFGENGFKHFPVSMYASLMPFKENIEHLAMYSQNLIYLLAAISDAQEIEFRLYSEQECKNNLLHQTDRHPTEKLRYESQDRTETDKNKQLWRRLCSLWVLVGNRSAVAKLGGWINAKENPDSIILRKFATGVNSGNFFESATLSCNDFEILLSLFETRPLFEVSSFDQFEYAESLIKRKPELSRLAFDAVIYFTDNELLPYGLNRMMEFFSSNMLSPIQSRALVEKVFFNRNNISIEEKYNYVSKYAASFTAGLIFKEIFSDLKSEPGVFYREILLRQTQDVLDIDYDIPLYLANNDPSGLNALMWILNENYGEVQLEHGYMYRTLEKCFGGMLRRALEIIEIRPVEAFSNVRTMRSMMNHRDMAENLYDSFRTEFSDLFSFQVISSIESPELLLEMIRLLESLQVFKHYTFDLMLVISHKVNDIFFQRDNESWVNLPILSEVLKTISGFARQDRSDFASALEYDVICGYLHTHFYRRHHYRNITTNRLVLLEICYSFVQLLPGMVDFLENLLRQSPRHFTDGDYYLTREKPEMTVKILAILNKLGALTPELGFITSQLKVNLMLVVIDKVHIHVMFHGKLLSELLNTLLERPFINNQRHDALHLEVIDKLLHNLYRGKMSVYKRFSNLIASALIRNEYPEGLISPFLEHAPELRKFYQQDRGKLQEILQITYQKNTN